MGPLDLGGLAEQASVTVLIKQKGQCAAFLCNTDIHFIPFPCSTCKRVSMSPHTVDLYLALEITDESRVSSSLTV